MIQNTIFYHLAFRVVGLIAAFTRRWIDLCHMQIIDFIDRHAMRYIQITCQRFAVQRQNYAKRLRRIQKIFVQLPFTLQHWASIPRVRVYIVDKIHPVVQSV